MEGALLMLKAAIPLPVTSEELRAVMPKKAKDAQCNNDGLLLHTNLFYANASRRNMR
jgi:hypothetical protein